MSKKLIVTHIFPDLDAVCSIWLLNRFDPELEQAELKFVPAGETYQRQPVDSDPDVVHVDTGLGRFDHHQSEEKICAAELVFNYLKSDKKLSLKDQSAVRRLVKLVREIDNFEDFFWPEAGADQYDLCLHQLLDYLKMSGRLNDKELVYQGFTLIDAVLFGIKEKMAAEKELESGVKFETKWGKAVGMETKLSRVMKLGMKQGYFLVVRKEPKTGFVAIKSQPREEIDLGGIYDRLKQKDKNASWFFHQSRHIILNGSRHNPKVRPSSLSLQQVIDLIKEEV